MPTLADRCVARFTAAKAEGRKLSMQEVHQIIHEEETNSKPARQSRVSTEVRSADSDVAWIAYLEALPHLQGIDIKREIGKCQLWASTNNQKPTRRRIINWLNRCEKTVTYNGTGQSSFQPKARTEQDIPEPQGWRVVCNTQEAYAQFKDRDWPTIPRYYQEQILKQLR